MGGAVEALVLEEAIQPAEVKQNHRGRLRIHPFRFPATILALSMFVLVVIKVWLGRRGRPWPEEGKGRPAGRPSFYSYTSPIRCSLVYVCCPQMLGLHGLYKDVPFFFRKDLYKDVEMSQLRL